jgi:hypothetical protein
VSLRTVMGRALALTAIVVPGVIGGAAAANAAAPALELHTGRLVYEQVSRGYHGVIPITITNHTAADMPLSADFVEPVAGTIYRDWDTPCFFGDLVDGRRSNSCTFPTLKAGATLRRNLTFDALISHRSYAMSGPDFTLTVSDGNTGASATATSTTRFRAANGSLAHPRRYVQDTQSKITMTAGRKVTLTEQEDGSFQGTLPITVTYKGDAPNEYLLLHGDLPGDARLWNMDPAAVCLDDCELAGGQFGPGDARSYTATIRVPAGTPAGVLGTGTLSVSPVWNAPITDVTPDDNSSAVAITVS